MAILNFPKRVDIHNPRLSLLHRILLCIVLIAVTCKFIFAQDYAAAVDISRDIHYELWAERPYQADVEAQIQLRRNSSPYCLTPEKYNYWWDSDGWITYTNYSCLPPCPHGFHGWDCFSTFHSAVSQPGSVLLATAISDVPIPDVATQFPEYIGYQNQWVWTAELMSLGFSYSYNVRRQPFTDAFRRIFHPIFLYDSDGGWEVGTSQTISGQKSLTTYIVDSKGKVWRVVPPGLSISLTLPEIFELIGNKEILDHPNEYLTENQLQGAAMPGKPVARLSGVRLDMEVACYNGPNPNLARQDLESDHDWGSVCTIRFLRPNAGWVYVERDFHRDGLLRRWYYGVQISVVPKGSFYFADLNEVFLKLVAALVVLGYPSRITLFIALYCLGHMSKIYKQKLVEDFDVASSVASTAARLTAGTSAFDILDGQSANHGISFEQFRKHVGTVLANRHDLHNEEVDSVAKYCFRELTERERIVKKGVRGNFAKLMEISGMGKKMDANGAPVDINAKIMLDDFLIAYNDESSITLDDLAVLFNQTRKVSVPERMFTPKRLKKQIHQAIRAPHLSDDYQVAIPANETTTNSDDVDSAMTDLCRLQGRLQDSESRLAAAELSLRDWLQRGADMASAMSAMEMRLRELERLVGQPPQTDCNAVVAPAKHREDVSAVCASEQAVSEQVQMRLSWLEQQVSLCFSLLEHKLSLLTAKFPEKPKPEGRSAQAVVTAAAAVPATAEEAESKTEAVTTVVTRVESRPDQECGDDPYETTGPPSAVTVVTEDLANHARTSQLRARGQDGTPHPDPHPFSIPAQYRILRPKCRSVGSRPI